MLCMFLSARVELLLEETARRTLLANPLVSWTTSNVNGKMTPAGTISCEEMFALGCLCSLVVFES